MAQCCDCNCATALCTVADPPVIRSVAGNGCVHFGLSLEDTSCIDLAITGTGALQATPIISPDTNNSLECRSNGLYTPGPLISNDSCNGLEQLSDGLFARRKGASAINSFQDYAVGYVLDPGDVAVNQRYHIQSDVLTDPPRVFNGSPTSAGWTTVPIANPSDCDTAHLFYNVQMSDVWASGLSGSSTPWHLQFFAMVFDPVTTNLIPLGPGLLLNGDNGDYQGLGVHDTDRIQSIAPGFSDNWRISGIMQVLQVGDAPVTFQNLGLLFMSGIIVIDY